MGDVEAVPAQLGIVGGREVDAKGQHGQRSRDQEGIDEGGSIVPDHPIALIQSETRR